LSVKDVEIEDKKICDQKAKCQKPANDQEIFSKQSLLYSRSIRPSWISINLMKSIPTALNTLKNLRPISSNVNNNTNNANLSGFPKTLDF